MARARGERSDSTRPLLLLAAAPGAFRRALAERLARASEGRGAAGGRRTRFRIAAASSGPEALRRGAEAEAAVVDLALPEGPGLDVIRELRERNPRLAILAYATSPHESDHLAAVMAGADLFHEGGREPAAIERALEVAVDRRRLTWTIERNEGEVEAARDRLARLTGELAATVPASPQLRSPEDVIPFREAARRYLLAAVRLFDRDPRGLASALGVSYFALRRLLARYDVPFPTVRSRG
jgi:DNA-binding NarL/FixJ family response regulator